MLDEGDQWHYGEAFPWDGYIPVKCSCGVPILAYGEILTHGSEERAMGPETWHTFTASDFDCTSCGQSNTADIDLWEYPEGVLTARDGEFIGCRPQLVQNLEAFISEVRDLTLGPKPIRDKVEALLELYREGLLEWTGDEAAAPTTLREWLAFILQKAERMVIVLGNHAHRETLHAVRDRLTASGYDATLIEDLPDVGHHSLPGKVKLWCGLARFCVMVDDGASGHVREYTDLVNDKVVIGRLRPRTGGSTWMIGEAELADVNHVRTFPYDSEPTDQLQLAVAWAEEYSAARTKAYDEFYPWRRPPIEDEDE